MKKELNIYTDGSCLNNPGKGGWGIVVQLPSGEIEEYSQGFRMTTNSRMEMLAILMALKYVDKHGKGTANILSDSNFIVQAIEKNWIDGWEKKGWKKTKNEPVANVDIWLKIYPLIKKLKVNIKKVKAHSGIELNEEVDELAKAAAMGESLKIDEWYELQTGDKDFVTSSSDKNENKIEFKNVLLNGVPSIRIKDGSKSITINRTQLEEFLK